MPLAFQLLAATLRHGLGEVLPELIQRLRRRLLGEPGVLARLRRLLLDPLDLRLHLLEREVKGGPKSMDVDFEKA